MAEDYSVRAILSAYDKGFSSAMQSAAKQTGLLDRGMGSMIKTGALMRVGMFAVDKAISTITSSMGAAVQRFDTMNNFGKVMGNLGQDVEESERELKKVSKRLTGLPTTTDQAASSIQRLTSSNNDVKKSSKYFLAMNDAIIAGGQPAAIQASAIEQLSQAYSKGRMDMMEWRSLQQAMPGQLNQVAKAMNMTSDELGEGLRTGSISMDDFMDTLVELDKKGVGKFKSFKDQAQDAVGGIQTNITNMKTSVVRGIANAMTAIDDALEKNNLPKMGEMIGSVSSAIDKGFEHINDVIGSVDFKGVVKAAKPYWNAFVSVLKTVGSAIKTVGTFLAEHAGIITKVGIPLVLMVATWSKLAGVLTVVKGPLTLITGGFSKLAGGVLAKLAPQLVTTAAAEAEAGTAAGTAAGNMLRMGAAIALMGVGVLMVGAGFGLMAQAAISLSSAGGAAIAVFFGMIAALAGLMALVSVLGPALLVGAIGMAAFGAAVLIMAAGVLVASVGLKIMASAMPVLASSAGVAAVGIAKLAAALVAMVPAAAGALAASGSLAALAAAAKLAGMGAKSGSKGIEKLSAASKTASTAVKALLATLKATGSAAKTAGKAVGQGFSTGIKSQKGAITAAGKNVAQGLINGLKSKRQAAYNEGVQAGKAYNKGLKKTEQVKSPSRVTAKIGGHIGQGLVNGLKDKNKLVEDMGVMAARLYNASLSPMGQVAYAGGLSDDYSYGRTIEVPLYINGREFAKATSSDIQNELSTRQTLKNRLSGRT